MTDTNFCPKRREKKREGKRGLLGRSHLALALLESFSRQKTGRLFCEKRGEGKEKGGKRKRERKKEERRKEGKTLALPVLAALLFRFEALVAQKGGKKKKREREERVKENPVRAGAWVADFVPESLERKERRKGGKRGEGKGGNTNPKPSLLFRA